MSSEITFSRAEATANGAAVKLAKGDELPAGCKTGIWRLVSGCLAVSEHSRDNWQTPRPLYLARPGDLVGAETLAGETPPDSARALAHSCLVNVTPASVEGQRELLVESVKAARRQAREMLHLRTGMLRGRVESILNLLGFTCGCAEQAELPTLRQLSALVDASPEAICRVLSSLRQDSAAPNPLPRTPATRLGRPLRMHAAALALVAGLALAAAPPSAMAHDFKLGPLRIDHPYATPTAEGARTGAVYIKTLRNTGDSADRLIGASTPMAARVELHRSVVDAQNVMRMRAVDAIELPARSERPLRHGGEHHLMLIDLKQALKDGGRFPITLRFEKAGEREVMVWVQTPRGVAAAHPHKH